MKLYSIKNTLTDRFNPPFVARDDDDAIETCRRAIIGGRDVSLLVELENLKLFVVGSFDAITGVLSSEAWCPCDIVSLDTIPLPEHVQELIYKIKKVEKDVDVNGVKSFFYKLLNKCEDKKKNKKDLKEEVKE